MQRLVLATAILAAATTAAGAATLDFDAFGAGTYGPTIALDGATITNTSGGNILVGEDAAGEDDGFCSLQPEAFNCEADTLIAFDDAVTNLSFDLDGSDPGDALTLFIYGTSGLLGFETYTTPDQSVDLSSYGAITSLQFDDNSIGAGYGYSTFVFDVAAVPVPASLPLLLAGLGGLAALRRRGRA